MQEGKIKKRLKDMNGTEYECLMVRTVLGPELQIRPKTFSGSGFVQWQPMNFSFSGNSEKISTFQNEIPTKITETTKKQ